MAKIAIIGTGYVGLTTGVCFASLGHDVVCADINSEKIQTLQQGQSPIFEDQIETLIQSGIESKKLTFTSDVFATLSKAQFVFLCLPTPQGDDGAADISRLISFVESNILNFPDNSILVNKSTVPIGTTNRLAMIIGRPDISLVSNPEFLREGTAVSDFFSADRLIIGAERREDAESVASLYGPLSAKAIVTDPTSAETIKYASNAFIATKISFANELAALCRSVGASTRDVILGVGSDSRIGLRSFTPGPGWGGSCLPKDTLALRHTARSQGLNLKILEATIQSNDSRLFGIASLILSEFGDRSSTSVVTILGLTFKAGTDDVRESPSLAVIKYLIEFGFRVKAYDPLVHKSTSSIHPDVLVCKSLEEACRDSDALVVMTEWPEFTKLDPVDCRKSMRGTKVFDFRDVLDRGQWRNEGFSIDGI